MQLVSPPFVEFRGHEAGGGRPNGERTGKGLGCRRCATRRYALASLVDLVRRLNRQDLHQDK